MLLKILLSEMGFKQGEPMKMYSESTSAIKLAKNPIYHKKTKHVEVDCRYSRENMQSVRLIDLIDQMGSGSTLSMALSREKT